MDHYQFLVAVERKYALALGRYDAAEHATEVIGGVKALAEADLRIRAEKKKLKAEMERIAASIRSVCDPEWTPGQLKGCDVRGGRAAILTPRPAAASGGL
jgi:hypothetical protein